MGTTTIVVAALLAALGGVLYRPVSTMMFVTTGMSRTMQPLSDFPYDCRKLTHPDLHACEDIVIDEVGRTAFLACSDSLNRKSWQPAVDRRSNSGRLKTDHFSVLSLDEPGSEGLFSPKTLKTVGYAGATGDGVLDLHGFDIEAIGSNKLRFWVVNHRPPVDAATGKELDAKTEGCNSTIEIFEHVRGSATLEWKYTYAHPLIDTPNRVAATGDGGFVMTNDKSMKTGWRRDLDLYIGGGNLVHCTHGQCQKGIPGTLAFPNGLVRSPKDGLYYVPSSTAGKIWVYTLMPQGTLTLLDTIHVGVPMDNLSVDKRGDIWAAAFPKLMESVGGFDDPLNARMPAAAIRIRKLAAGGYEVTKMLEDDKGEVLPMTTSVAHDATTGRLFFGSVFAPYTAVCDPRK